jgi:hypothetical protein
MNGTTPCQVPVAPVGSERPHLALLLEGLEERAVLVPRLGCGDPSGLCQVLAVEQGAGFHVPRNAVLGSLERGGLDRAGVEGIVVDEVGRDLLQPARGRERREVDRTDHGGVRSVSRGDRRLHLLGVVLPGNGCHLDLRAGIFLAELGGQLGQELALGSHRPHGDGAAGGQGVDGIARRGLRRRGVGPAAAGQEQCDGHTADECLRNA